MLADRIGFFNKPMDKLQITNPDPLSTMYVNEAERFNKDFAAFEYEQRHEKMAKYKKKMQTFREMLFTREQERWSKIKAEIKKKENSFVSNKDTHMLGFKNKPG